MATFTGHFEDANGNLYYSSCESSDVIMSDGSTAEDAIYMLNVLGTTINNHIRNLDTQFTTLLSSEEEEGE